MRNDVAVTPHSDAGSRKAPLVGIAFADIPWIPHQVRNDVKYRVGHRVTPHHDAGSSKVPLVGIAFASISGYRVKHRVTPHPMRGPERGLLWVLPLPVFLDSASSAE